MEDGAGDAPGHKKYDWKNPLKKLLDRNLRHSFCGNQRAFIVFPGGRVWLARVEDADFALTVSTVIDNLHSDGDGG